MAASRRPTPGLFAPMFVTLVSNSIAEIALGRFTRVRRPIALNRQRSRHGMEERQAEQIREAQKAQAEYIKSVATSGSSTDEIANAKGLLDSGAITQAEFDQIKAKALSAS